MKGFGILLILSGLVLIGIFGYNYVGTEQAQEDSLTEAERRIAEGQAQLRQLAGKEPAGQEEQVIVKKKQQVEDGKRVDHTLEGASATDTKAFNHAQSNMNDQPQGKKEIGLRGENQVPNSKGSANTQTPKESIHFQAEYNEAIATLEIPKLGKTLAVIEGTDPYALAKGVGHLSESVFPGDGEQIMLSGHRDTVFRNFGQLEIDDHFVVNMPYGSYTYIIKDTEIVAEDDTSIIREMNEEVLVVTTCYPFRYFGPAPKRFIIYAYPE